MLKRNFEEEKMDLVKKQKKDEIKLVSNLFPIEYPNDFTVIMYDVKFDTNEKEKKGQQSKFKSKKKKSLKKKIVEN